MSDEPNQPTTTTETATTEAETPPVEPAKEPEAPKEPEAQAEAFKLEDLKFSEGFTVDTPIAEAFVDIVNKRGLSREVVSDLVALQEKAVKASSEAGSQLWADTQEQWRKEVLADPSIGGDKWEATSNRIDQIIDKYGSPEVRAAHDLTGAGNNPHIVRMMAKIAAELTEAKFISSGTTSTSPAQDLASRLYPTMK